MLWGCTEEILQIKTSKRHFFGSDSGNICQFDGRQNFDQKGEGGGTST